MSRMPIEEELRMFHRLQRWRRTAIGLGTFLLLLIYGEVVFVSELVRSAKQQSDLKFSPQPQVEIMREPPAKKIDNLTHA